MRAPSEALLCTILREISVFSLLFSIVLFFSLSFYFRVPNNVFDLGISSSAFLSHTVVLVATYRTSAVSSETEISL